MSRIDRILVPTDFGEASARALDHALHLARRLKVELHLLHVMTEPVATPPSMHDRQRIREVRQKLDELPHPGGDQDLTIVREIDHGLPAERIVRYALDHGIDLIVMGTRGRGGLAHLLMGSVAERVIRQSHCPVLAAQPVRDRPRLEAAAAVLRSRLGESVPGNLNESRVRMVQILAEAMNVDRARAEEIFNDLVSEQVLAPSVSAEGSADGPRWVIEPERLVSPSAATGEAAGPALDLIHRALDAGASDLHVAPEGDGEYAVRFRIDGRLERYCPLHPDLAGPLFRQYRLMANLDIAEPFRPHEGRLNLPSSLAGVEARITCMPVAGGEALALRLQQSGRLMQPLDRLGLADDARDAIQRMLAHGAGLVLVTGPTGSGKTTTVYSLLKLLDNGRRQMVSIEDPVEYRVPFIRQAEVDPRHDVTMATGLRTILRMDPDVVFVGEIRDIEAAEIGMRAASSGRYVFSTLHTRDVASTVTALRDLHIDNRSLAGNLVGIINQRLVRRLCLECRTEIPSDDAVLQIFKAEGLEPPARVGGPAGCPACRGTGFRGRIGVFEAVVTEGPIVAAIQQGAPEDELRRLIRSGGTPNLLAAALALAAQGVTNPEEAQGILWV